MSLRAGAESLRQPTERFRATMARHDGLPVNPGEQWTTVAESYEGIADQVKRLTAIVTSMAPVTPMAQELSRGKDEMDRLAPSMANLRSTGELMSKNFGKTQPVALVTRLPMPGRMHYSADDKCKVERCNGKNNGETLIWLERIMTYAGMRDLTEAATIGLMLQKSDSKLYTQIKHDNDLQADLVSIVDNIETYIAKVPAIDEAGILLDRTSKKHSESYSEYIEKLRTMASFVVRDKPFDRRAQESDKLALSQLKRTLPSHLFQKLKDMETYEVNQGRPKFKLHDYKRWLNQLVDEVQMRKERLDMDQKVGEFMAPTAENLIPLLNEVETKAQADKDSKSKTQVNYIQKKPPVQTRTSSRGRFSFRGGRGRSSGAANRRTNRVFLLDVESNTSTVMEMEASEDEDESGEVSEEFEEGETEELEVDEEEEEKADEGVNSVFKEPPPSTAAPPFKKQPYMTMETLIKKANLKDPNDCIKCGFSGHISTNKRDCPLAGVILTKEPCPLCQIGLHPAEKCARSKGPGAVHPADRQPRRQRGRDGTKN